jgi:hypothetical protein
MYLYPFSQPFLLLRKTVCRELQAQDRSPVRLQNAEEHQYAGIAVIIVVSPSRTQAVIFRSSL